MKRAKHLESIELHFPCQSAGDPDKAWLRVKTIRHCNCDECRRVYNDITRVAVEHFKRKRTETP